MREPFAHAARVSSASRRILLVDSDPDHSEELSRHLRKQGFIVFAAANAAQAVTLFGAARPALVLTNVALPDGDGVTLLGELREMDRLVLVMLMTGNGDAESILRALRAGAIDFLIKPVDLGELVNSIERTLGHRFQETSADYSPHLIAERKRFAFAARDAMPTPIINQVTAQLPLLVDDADVVNIKVGVEEMILNAIEYGCLRICGQAKRAAVQLGSYGELYRERLETSELGTAGIVVHYDLNERRLRVQIADPGDGFDWRTVATVSPEHLRADMGRGILLARMAFDEVAYSDAGNRVTLVKHRSRPYDHVAADGREGAERVTGGVGSSSPPRPAGTLATPRLAVPRL